MTRYRILWHFIWIFTACRSTSLGVPSLQTFEESHANSMSRILTSKKANALILERGTLPCPEIKYGVSTDQWKCVPCTINHGAENQSILCIKTRMYNSREGGKYQEYHNWPRTPYGKVTKHKKTQHKRELRVQPFTSRWSQSCKEHTRQHNKDKHEA